MLKNQKGFHHLGLLLLILVLAVIGFVAWRVWALPKALPNVTQMPIVGFNYTRDYKEPIKGVLDPGRDQVTNLLTDELANVRALGANTIYIYVDYSYKDGKLQYTQHGKDNLDEAAVEQEYIAAIKLAKQKGFAVHLTLAFGGGANTPFNVPLEQLLADIQAADLKWAAIGEQYKVEYYAPSSEIDYQIFREYYGSDWSNKAAHKEATEISNRYHSDVLPEVRKIFSGKIIYQAGLWSSYSGSKGYDIFGIGVNSVNVELADWRRQVKEIFGYAQGNAKRQGSEWMVTELWIPVNQTGVPSKTPSGTPYAQIQDKLYEAVFDEYKKVTGQKPVGLSFTSYVSTHAKVKGTPAEAVIKRFFNSLD